MISVPMFIVWLFQLLSFGFLLFFVCKQNMLEKSVYSDDRYFLFVYVGGALKSA
jgi:hypothetical protein